MFLELCVVFSHVFLVNEIKLSVGGAIFHVVSSATGPSTAHGFFFLIQSDLTA